jgi:hypothetical protein
VTEIVVSDDSGLARLRTAYLEAVSLGATSLTVVLRAGTLGLDPSVLSGELSLARTETSEPPPIDVVLRSEGVTVLARLPLAVAARSVTLEGLAFAGALAPPIRITASESVALRRVTVLGAQAGERRRAVVDLTAWAPDVTLDVDSTTLARSSAPDALLGCYAGENGWFSGIVLSDSTLSGNGSDATVAVAAAGALDWKGSLLASGTSRALVRMDWPPKRGTVSGCGLSVDRPPLLEVRNPAPVEVEPVRLVGGTRLDIAPAAAGDGVTCDDTVVEDAAIGEEAAQSVARTRAELAEADPRLEPLLG